MRRTFRLWCLIIACLASLHPLIGWAGEVPEPRRTPVIVVGGGLAGLLTAYELEKMGVASTIVEASDRLGGRIATAEYGKGLQAEFGMQEIWQKSPLMRVVAELKLDTESGDDPWSSFLIDGRLHPYAQETREAYFRALFTPEERKAFDAAISEMEQRFRESEGERLTPSLEKMQAVSWADWLAERKLPSKVEQVLRLTIEVELGAVSEQFSALSALLEWRVFLFGGEKNYHIKGGNSRLIEALAAHLHGPRLLNAQVVAIKRTPRGAGRYDCEVTCTVGRDVKRLHADAVVVAIPWVRLHGIQFEPSIDADRWKAINSLGRGQYTVLHFIMGKGFESLWGADGPFPVLSGGPLGVIYGPHGQRGAGGEGVFSLLVTGFEAQAYHMKPRDAKRVETLAALDALWPGFSRFVKEAFVYGYHPAAVAYWPPGRSPLDAGSALLRTPMEALFLAGDWLYSSHSEGAAISGLTTAKAVARYLRR